MSFRYGPLWLIVALLLLPFVLATGLYFGGWRPPVEVRGELLAAGQPRLPDEAMEGRWGLALVSDGPCAAPCVAELDRLHRVHVALYKAMPAVQRFWIADREQLVAAAEGLQKRWPDLHLLVADETLRLTLVAREGARPAGDGVAQGSAVIVFDPQGRPVLRYLLPADPKAILTDLRRLLAPTR